ncbi:LicD family protein [Actinomyces vulturis]|uniref:LicD family protein n=1 Tax=Actinomyces vulturis TaxID=1857645 RepID=UPI00082EF74D|nr:LicD family protein [Actinomyces vulturis]
MNTTACDPQLLRSIQLATTDVLVEFDRVCKILGCQYVMYGGTAIGAVRHHGFIPWDDDADVCMPREDYERFLAHAAEYLNPHIMIVDPERIPDYPTTFAVIGIRDSQFISTTAKDRPFVMPVGVDIFPLDAAAPSQKDFNRQCRETWLWGRLLFVLGTPRAATGLPQPLALLANSAMYSAHWLMRGIHLKSKMIYSRWKSIARRYEHDQSNGNQRLLADFSTRDPKHWSVTYDELFPAGEAVFEGFTLKIPHLYDRVLARGYGDYMCEPSPEDRVNHQPFHIDFGPWTGPGSLSTH